MAGVQQRPVIKPVYKVVRDLKGGINTSQPVDQIAENEAALASNLTYMNRVLCVDFGLVQVGSALYGNPQQPILWKSPAGVSYSLLVTTKTLYLWNVTLQDWLPVTNTTTNGASTNALVTGAGTDPSISFTGTASWTTGNNIAALMDNGLYLVGAASGTTSPVTLATPLPVGRSIPSGNPILSVPTFTAIGTLPVSSNADPFRGVLFITNGTDHVQIFDGTKCIDEPNVLAAGIEAARYVTRFQYITCLLATTESGTFYTYRVRRSATNDSTNWTTLNSGFDDLIDTSDDITGGFLLNQAMAITRRSSLMAAVYYGLGEQVFWYSYALSGTGCIGLLASAATRLNSCVIDTSGIYFYSGSANIEDIGEKIYNAILSYTGDLVPNTNDKIYTYYNSLLDETWILYQAGIQTAPASMWKYSHKQKSWHRRDFTSPLAFVGIGPFSQGNTGLQWNQDTRTWNQSSIAWNAAANQVSFETQIFCGAADNKVYAYNYVATSDAGNAIAWTYTTKAMPIPDEYEDLDGLVFYGQGTIALVEVSTDGVIWTPWATNVAMGTSWSRAEIDGQLTSGFFQIRLSGTDPSFKLSWWAAKYLPASER